ncbi:MAG: hypothetical protein ABSC15_07750 [Terriglobales bacterium]|jgi:hypothetical protein
MRLGETIATYDVGLALRGKSGKFEVTSPDGEIYDVTCKASYSVSNGEWSSNGNDNSPFLIRKVAERASPADTTAKTTGVHEAESPTASSAFPLVLERAADERRLSNPGNIELSYLEDDPGTGQPSACVYLTSELRIQEFEAEKMMTSQCATFNELDCEIRRLQARLDEIRAHAKKMFYKAHSVAASA